MFNMVITGMVVFYTPFVTDIAINDAVIADTVIADHCVDLAAGRLSDNQ